MIPTHHSNRTNRSQIVVNRLSTLNEYDFSEAHRHNYFEFFCFIEGGGTHVIDFNEFTIDSMSIHIVAPGQVHQVNRELTSFGFVTLFELDALQAIPEVEMFLFDHACRDAENGGQSYKIKTEKFEWFKSMTDRLWELNTSESSLKSLEMRTILQHLALACMEESDLETTVSSSEYTQFRRLVHREFRKLKMVKHYAQILNVSDKSLNEMVKKHTGKSASQIIHDQIILEAKRLLQTGMSAKETAYDLQFDDPAHFSKFFKSKTGISPSDFRAINS